MAEVQDGNRRYWVVTVHEVKTQRIGFILLTFGPMGTLVRLSPQPDRKTRKEGSTTIDDTNLLGEAIEGERGRESSLLRYFS